jgi:hypothetical protein
MRGISEHAGSCRTGGSAVVPDSPAEDRLCHEGFDAEALRGKGIAQGPVDGLGLPGRVGDPGGPAEHEQLVGHRTTQPMNVGHDVIRLDLPFGMMGVHSGLSFVTTRERARPRMVIDCPCGVPELSSAGTSAKRDVPGRLVWRAEDVECGLMCRAICSY